MTSIRKNKNPLTDRPIKTSQSTGSALASMGLQNCIPLMHGSQGCGAFAKVYLIQHFREPMPIQNTGMDQIASVMGGDSNLTEALKLLCEKNDPDLISVMSTGLSELQGTDLQRVIKEFKAQYPEFEKKLIIHANTPDFTGSAQTGFAHTIEQVIKSLAKPVNVVSSVAMTGINRERGPEIESASGPAKVKSSSNRPENNINIICSIAMTPADAEHLEMLVQLFGFNAILIPNLSDSLDGHLADEAFSATSTGGTPIHQIQSMLCNRATLVIGESMGSTSQWLQKQNQTCIEFPHLMGLEQTDKLIHFLTTESGLPVPKSIDRARKRYMDTLLDAHFYLSGTKLASALESDLTLGYSAICQDIGIDHLLAVTTQNSSALKQMSCEEVVIGDHSDLDAVIPDIDILIGNTHCAAFFEAKVPVLRAGYPCHDRLGVSDNVQIGYLGARSQIHAMANLVLAAQVDEVESYVSPYRFDHVIPNSLDTLNQPGPLKSEQSRLRHA